MNIERNKDPKRRRLSIDGVSPRPSKPVGSIGFDRPVGGSPGMPSRRLDNFNRPGGFDARAARNRPIAIPKRPQYGSPEKNKRYYLRFWKNRRSLAPDKKKRKHIKLKIAGVILLIFLAVFGFLFTKGYINLRKVLPGGGSAAALEANVDPSKLREEGDGRINILVMGRGGFGHDGPDLTDTMILVSIDPVTKEAGLVSIPRDLYVNVPDYGSMKINQVYYTGKTQFYSNTTKRSKQITREAQNAGFKLVDKTVEDVLGLPVHYHVMVDFSAFKEAVNTVGGVDINVPGAVYEHMRIDGQDYTLNVKPGPHHFEGFEALAYARSRHTSSRGDFDRSERQRLMIVALKTKILSLGTFSNPAKISALIGQFGNHVQTNFSTGDVSKLYELVKQINSSKVTSIGLNDPPNNFVTTSYINGLSVVVPTAGLDNYDIIHYYIRNVLRDSFLKMENSKILILNGTNKVGLAQGKAYELRSFGYRVVSEGNAPAENYSKTMLIDLGHSDKRYTRHYLEKRLGTWSTSSLPVGVNPGDADFVIILGNDSSG